MEYLKRIADDVLQDCFDASGPALVEGSIGGDTTRLEDEWLERRGAPAICGVCRIKVY